MKNTKKQNWSMLGLILLLGLSASTLNAQMGATYAIQNNRNCRIAVHYEVSTCFSSIICNSTYQLISPRSAFVLPASCVMSTNDIFVWLKEINFVDVTGGNNLGSVSGGACLVSGGLFVSRTNSPPSCPPLLWTMLWTPTAVVIN